LYQFRRRPHRRPRQLDGPCWPRPRTRSRRPARRRRRSALRSRLIAASLLLLRPARVDRIGQAAFTTTNWMSPVPWRAPWTDFPRSLSQSAPRVVSAARFPLQRVDLRPQHLRALGGRHADGREEQHDNQRASPRHPAQRGRSAAQPLESDAGERERAAIGRRHARRRRPGLPERLLTGEPTPPHCGSGAPPPSSTSLRSEVTVSSRLSRSAPRVTKAGSTVRTAIA
jgi:hypothetical protein